MKRIVALLLALCLAACLCACGDSAAEPGKMKVVLDSNEYNLYQNIFFNDGAAEYVGEKQSKTGIFTTIRDSFNQTTRYYVWGFFDNTKCCDWQWELKLDGSADLPADGSYITATGTFTGDETALDKYWMTDVSIEVKQPYEGEPCDIDMTTMSATLARVQLINMQNFVSEYEGKTVRAYGRVYTASQIQHPFYDEAWVQDFSFSGEVPAIGTEVIVSGTFGAGSSSASVITADSVEVNRDL